MFHVEYCGALGYAKIQDGEKPSVRLKIQRESALKVCLLWGTRGFGGCVSPRNEKSRVWATPTILFKRKKKNRKIWGLAIVMSPDMCYLTLVF